MTLVPGTMTTETFTAAALRFRTARQWFLPGIGTDASPLTHADCFLITGSGNSRIDIYYGDGGHTATPTIVDATLTTEPDSNGGLRLTAKATNGSNAVTTGSFTFAYSDQGTTHTKNVGIDPATGAAYCVLDDLPANGLVLTAKYRDSTHTFDALITMLCYSLDAIDLSTVHADGYGGSYTYSSNTVTLAKNGWYVFTGSTSGANANKIAVQGGVSACVTLDHASIDVSGSTDRCAFPPDPGAPGPDILIHKHLHLSGYNGVGKILFRSDLRLKLE